MFYKTRNRSSKEHPLIGCLWNDKWFLCAIALKSSCRSLKHKNRCQVIWPIIKKNDYATEHPEQTNGSFPSPSDLNFCVKLLLITAVSLCKWIWMWNRGLFPHACQQATAQHRKQSLPISHSRSSKPRQGHALSLFSTSFSITAPNSQTAHAWYMADMVIVFLAEVVLDWRSASCAWCYVHDLANSTWTPTHH